MNFALCIEELGLSVRSYNLDDSANPTAILDWDGDDPKPTIEDLEAVWPTVQAKMYADNRMRAYPSIQEQLDMQYHDALNGTTTWVDAIAAVKAEYPKP